MKNQKEPFNTTRSPDAPYEDFASFEELFSQARGRLEYSVEGAKNEFTEKIVARMRELNISKSDLAERLNAKRPFVTRLLSGQNNFTLETMVRIGRALDCNLRSHLEPEECETHWVNVIRGTMPNDTPSLKRTRFGNFKEIRRTKTIKTSPNHAPVPAVA